MSYSDEERLNYVFENSPMMDSRRGNGSTSHWIKVWDNHSSDWVVYHGESYRACIDQALEANRKSRTKRLQR